MATPKAQNAGLKTRPNCSLVMWNVAASAGATSPRITNDIDVVASETQLATNRRCLLMVAMGRVAWYFVSWNYSSDIRCQVRPHARARRDSRGDRRTPRLPMVARGDAAGRDAARRGAFHRAGWVHVVSDRLAAAGAVALCGRVRAARCRAAA